MPTWLIIVLAVLLLLAVGGAIARAMVQRRTEAEFRARLERANHDLAEAAADDRGWDREVLESAARRIFAEQRGADPSELLLVEGAAGSHHFLTLGRQDGDWVLESVD
jgi:hypothetical protein